MRTQLFGVLRSYNGLNKVETNSSVISKGIAISCRFNLCCDTHVHMNTNSFDNWSISQLYPTANFLSDSGRVFITSE